MVTDKSCLGQAHLSRRSCSPSHLVNFQFRRIDCDQVCLQVRLRVWAVSIFRRGLWRRAPRFL